MELSTDGQPHYAIHEQIAWEAIAMVPSAFATVANANAVCFGSLAQRSPVSRASIRTLVHASPPEALRIFDINLRQAFYTRATIAASLALADVLKSVTGPVGSITPPHRSAEEMPETKLPR